MNIGDKTAFICHAERRLFLAARCEQICAPTENRSPVTVATDPSMFFSTDTSLPVESPNQEIYVTVMVDSCGLEPSDISNFTAESTTSSINNSCTLSKQLPSNLDELSQQILFPFKCQFCGGGFLSSRELQDHVLRWHNSRNDNSAKSTLKDMQTSELSLNCPFCGKEVRGLDNIRQHMKDLHDMNVEETISISDEAKFETDIESLQLQCQECPEQQTVLDDYAELDTESENTEENLPVEMDSGEDKATNEQPNVNITPKHDARNPKTSKQTPNEKSSFSCHTCRRKFRTFRQLKLHMASHRKQQSRSWACECCGEKFASAKDRTEHYDTNHSETTCVQCGVLCLKEEGSEICSKCSRTDTAASAVKTEDVNVAEFGMVSESNAQNETSETPGAGEDEKQFHRCPVCSLTFRWSHNINRHIKAAHALSVTSDGDDVQSNCRPHPASNKYFMCLKCELRFDKVTEFRNHLKEHHHGQLISADHSAAPLRVSSKNLDEQCSCCQVCGQVFRWPNSLMRHMKNQHSMSLKKMAPHKRALEDFEQEVTLEMSHDNIEASELVTRNDIEESADNRLQENYENCQDQLPPNEATNDVVQPNEDGIYGESGQYAYQCPECNQSYSLYHGLRRHLKDQHPELLVVVKNRISSSKHSAAASSASKQKFICQLCGRLFNWRGNLDRHMKTVHAWAMDETQLGVLPETAGTKPKFLTCPHCARTFIKAQMLQKHLHDEHQNSMSYNCPVCGRLFRWLNSTYRHIRTAHPGSAKNVRTGIGMAVTSDQDEMNAQCLGARYQCPQCDQSFDQYQSLRKHFRWSHPQFPPLRPKSSLQKTISSILCSVCGLCLSSPLMLQNHMQSKHAGNLKPYLCPKCGKTFSTRSQLTAHLPLKHGGAHFVCDICNRELSCKSALAVHKHTKHSESSTLTDRYFCQVCKRGFPFPAMLQKHMAAHSDTGDVKRKAMCSVCGLLFRHVTALAKHIESSHEAGSCDKPFCCAVCNEQFHTSAAVKQHYKYMYKRKLH